MKSSAFFNTIIIGAGPAGLFAAANLTVNDVMLIEKNKLPGRKLMISGSGQCNFTHYGRIDDFEEHYGSNSDFVMHALRNFTNENTIHYFKTRGIQILIDKNGKVFPRSLKAVEVLNILLHEIKKREVELLYEHAVLDVKKSRSHFVVSLNNCQYTCRHLIISTGGLSWPQTGSNGDGYGFARALGHTIIQPQPALCPVIPVAYPFASLSGISLSRVHLNLYRAGKWIRDYKGDMAFTHTGITGPAILDFSRYIHPGDILKINLTGISAEEMEQRFIKQSQAGGTTLLSFLRNQSVVKNLAIALLENLQLSRDKPLSEVSAKHRRQLIQSCCAFPFEVNELAGFKKAMATAGGVSLNEINPLTMESRLVKNLYFTGEVLDIDGDTGGYNIQAAFSTAWLAAQNINMPGKLNL